MEDGTLTIEERVELIEEELKQYRIAIESIADAIGGLTIHLNKLKEKVDTMDGLIGTLFIMKKGDLR